MYVSVSVWQAVFDASYRQQFLTAGLLPDGELKHLISDAATMQIIRWTKGGFGMAAHNYDGDMLTDEVAVSSIHGRMYVCMYEEKRWMYTMHAIYECMNVCMYVCMYVCTLT